MYGFSDHLNGMLPTRLRAERHGSSRYSTRIRPQYTGRAPPSGGGGQVGRRRARLRTRAPGERRPGGPDGDERREQEPRCQPVEDPRSEGEAEAALHQRDDDDVVREIEKQRRAPEDDQRPQRRTAAREVKARGERSEDPREDPGHR